ncbi:hypothetical protein RHMOL_Rhmol06G0042600 [Rhododendron molle]|uniref:Uncharacterized protein n=1 Tax=Rhododendron molle TaxID=49168 RepID=A0ACC0N9X6_RHOML|nr:hypothetical protein RHMOL_Rhmol06G0042600 [Rhododendron molle]
MAMCTTMKGHAHIPGIYELNSKNLRLHKKQKQQDFRHNKCLILQKWVSERT